MKYTGNEKQMVHLRIPVKLLSEIDKCIQEGLYSNRTEYIHAAIRDKVKSEA